MSRVVRFEAAARVEFDEAIEWYERKRPGLGREFDAEVNSVLDRISQQPEHFRFITRTVRKARVRRFPYSIYFAESSNVIGVVAIFHGKRDPAVLRERLLT